MGLLSKVKNFFCNILGIKTQEEKEASIQKEKDLPGSGQEQSPTSEKEKKEREWKDAEEQLKFVCQGGKVQCTFCSTPIVDILPTSTQVMLQDKPYATVEDKDGKKNFAFTGTCNHPSQQKPGSPPPPCKAVISLGMWKDFSETMIDDYNALLVKSTIPCMISGQDLKITHSGQMAELAEIKPKVKRNPQIIESYWINEDKERIEKIAPNKKASLIIKTKDYRKKDKLKITLPINGEEREYVTSVNSEGIAILENIFIYEANHLKKEPRIIEAYWRNEYGEKISEVYADEKAELFIRTEGYDDPDSKIKITLKKEKKDETFKSGKETLELVADINHEGIAIIKNFKRWS